MTKSDATKNALANQARPERSAGFFTSGAAMTPADILAITLAAAVGLYLAYRIIMRLAAGIIDAIDNLTRHE